MLKKTKAVKDKQRPPAHDVILSEILNDVSVLSDSSKSKDDRHVRIRSMETKCGVLGKMDMPKDVHTSVEKRMKDMLDAIKNEIDSKTAASNVIAACLKDMRDA